MYTHTVCVASCFLQAASIPVLDKQQPYSLSCYTLVPVIPVTRQASTLEGTDAYCIWSSGRDAAGRGSQTDLFLTHLDSAKTLKLRAAASSFSPRNMHGRHGRQQLCVPCAAFLFFFGSFLPPMRDEVTQPCFAALEYKRVVLLWSVLQWLHAVPIISIRLAVLNVNLCCCMRCSFFFW